MKVEQRTWTDESAWHGPAELGGEARLVFLFGGREVLQGSSWREGAADAARTRKLATADRSPDLAILTSCVGRKLVLEQRTEEEVESVREVLGDRTALTGFYSYGEICPVAREANGQLHNQTMTITTFSEA